MRPRTPLTAQAVIGDRFSLIMEANARHGDTIIKKGAEVQGRVRWIETGTCPSRCFVVAIELLSVTTADGSSHLLYCSLRQVAPDLKVKLGISQGAQTVTQQAYGMQGALVYRSGLPKFRVSARSS
jgi:hypothetical protein